MTSFSGLGIPATMLGHDPDWTHHTSEDKIDKTDASEFKRVGVFACAAVQYLALGEEQLDFSLRASVDRIRVDELASRVARDLDNLLSSSAANRRIGTNRRSLKTATALLDLDINPERSSIPQETLESLKPRKQQSLQGQGPRRLTILPLDASAFEGVSAEDGKWLAEQEARFASDSEGLATKPNFALISFEAENFMDGKRGTAEIADLLSAEYLLDIDQAWVDRLVSILEKQKLVAK